MKAMAITRLNATRENNLKISQHYENIVWNRGEIKKAGSHCGNKDILSIFLMSFLPHLICFLSADFCSFDQSFLFEHDVYLLPL